MHRKYSVALWKSYTSPDSVCPSGGSISSKPKLSNVCWSGGLRCRRSKHITNGSPLLHSAHVRLCSTKRRRKEHTEHRAWLQGPTHTKLIRSPSSRHTTQASIGTSIIIALESDDLCGRLEPLSFLEDFLLFPLCLLLTDLLSDMLLLGLVLSLLSRFLRERHTWQRQEDKDQ